MPEPSYLPIPESLMERALLAHGCVNGQIIKNLVHPIHTSDPIGPEGQKRTVVADPQTLVPSKIDPLILLSDQSTPNHIIIDEDAETTLTSKLGELALGSIQEFYTCLIPEWNLRWVRWKLLD